MRRLLLLIALILSVGANAQQQTGAITGLVTSADGQTAEFITVSVKNKAISVTTNSKGIFLISRIKPGNYTLVATAVGLNKTEQTVTVVANKTATLNFTLSEKKEILKEVSIASRKNRYTVTQPSSSLRLSEPLLEVPQNIQAVSEQVLKDQQIISMSDGLIRNVSGAVRLEHWGDMYTNITMRGSQIQAMRNGFNVVASYWGPLTEDMSIVDHIEFVKGPAGFLLSNGDPSGMYNVVTKKPTGINKGEATVTLGSFDLYRTAFDLDRRVTNDGKLLFRLNAAVQKKGSFRPYEYNDRYTFAPTLSYQLTSSTKLTAEYTLQNARMTEVGSFYIFSPEGYATLPRDFTLTQPGVQPTRINDHSAFVNLTQQMGSHWKLTAQASYFKYLQNGYSSWPTSVFANQTLIRNVGIWDAESTMRLGQLFINGEAKTAGINHRILVGFDGGKKDYQADWGQSHDLDTPTDPFQLNNPDYGFPPNGYPNFDRTTSLAQRSLAIGGILDQKYLSAYAQDELGFFDNKLRLTLAGRYTYVSQSAWGGKPDKAKKVTPRIGLSFSIDKNTSVYTIYDQAFVPQSGLLRNGTNAKPITGNSAEIGLKRDWLDGKWNTSLSVYRILKQNELTADPSNQSNESFSIVLGEKKAEGIEFDIRGEIAKGLRLTANYAYTKAIVNKVAPGLTQFTVGDLVPGYATHVANAWLNYTAQTGLLKGFGVNGGFTYQGDRATYNYSTSNPEQNLPDYFKVDGGLTYTAGKIKFTANVFNILDKFLYNGAYYTKYWNAPDYKQPAYSWQAEAPRNFRASLNYSF